MPRISSTPRSRKASSRDFSKNPRGYYGGNVAGCPQPVTPYWPRGKEKRKVRCQVSTWVGTSAIGAKHYYAKVEEEENYIWDGNKWCKLWDHPRDLLGRIFRKECLSNASAMRWINAILKRHFSIRTHEVSSLYENVAPASAYLRYRTSD